MKVRDVVAVCETCGESYVQATRIGVFRLEMNASCPRCAAALPIPMRPDQPPPVLPRENEAEGEIPGNRPKPGRL